MTKVGVTVGVADAVSVGVAVTAGVAVAVPLVHGIPEGLVHEQYMPLGMGG